MALRVNQKLSIKKTLLWSFGGIVLIASLVIVANFWNPENAQAKQGEIIEVEEQSYTTEMSLPEPVIHSKHLPSSKTIFSRPIKPINNASNLSNE